MEPPGKLNSYVCPILDPNNDSFKLYSALLEALLSSFLPAINPEIENTFEENIAKIQSSLSNSIRQLQRIDKSLGLPKYIVVHAVLLSGEHSDVGVWTSSQTIIYANQLLKEVLTHCDCQSLTNLLVKYNMDSFLKELKPKLLTTTWKSYPAAVVCYKWILLNLEYPYLGNVLDTILPTCLNLFDDHLIKNKLIGLQCLQHIAINVSWTELHQYNRGEVIYNALEHMIYSREVEILAPLANCLVALLSKTEHNITTNNILWNHFDDVLNIWLSSMELEQKLILRDVYIDGLNSLLKAMGIAAIRWSIKLLSILSEYCEHDQTRERSLMCLLTFMKVTWPRMSINFLVIMNILVRVSMNVCHLDSTETVLTEPSLVLIRKCLKLLHAHCSTKYDFFVSELKNSSNMNQSGKNLFLLLKFN